MTIKYKIRFFSEWHCGSGLSAGADLDSLVIKDKKGFPYIPGKTIKGLVREAVEDLVYFRGNNKEQQIKEAFGYFEEKERSMNKGFCFFTNATLPEDQQEFVASKDLQRFLYRATSATAIGTDGIVVEHSLRKTETTIPCELHGEILDLPEAIGKEVVESLKLIKRIGLNRNRGLGRCQFLQIEKGNNQ